MPKSPLLDIFYLDGFDWTDALGFFQVPHRTNDIEVSDNKTYHSNSETFHYQIRKVDGDDLIVLWRNRDEPNLAEIRAWIENDCQD